MRITSWRGMLLAGSVSLLIIYFVWWGRMIGDPVERSGADFIAFYAAGRVAQAHGFTSIYDIEQQQTIEQEVVGFPLAEGQVLLYNHMPYLVPLLALVVNENYVGSFERWILVLISIYLIGTQFLIKSLFAARKGRCTFCIADRHPCIFPTVHQPVAGTGYCLSISWCSVLVYRDSEKTGLADCCGAGSRNCPPTYQHRPGCSSSFPISKSMVAFPAPDKPAGTF